MIQDANRLNPYKEFTDRLKLLVRKNPILISNTLSNIFTMRLIGNKTHGDLAEIAIAEFINQYMYDFRSIHVGKDLFRAKSREEDITIINEMTEAEFPVSLKAYGNGPLQLSTDKNFRMFPRLEQERRRVIGREAAQTILQDPVFAEFDSINVLPLIYDERNSLCNILVFDYGRAASDVDRIEKIESGRGRRHPCISVLQLCWRLHLRSALRGRDSERASTRAVDSYKERGAIFRQHYRWMDRLLAQPSSRAAIFPCSGFLGIRTRISARRSDKRH